MSRYVFSSSVDPPKCVPSFDGCHYVSFYIGSFDELQDPKAMEDIPKCC